MLLIKKITGTLDIKKKACYSSTISNIETLPLFERTESDAVNGKAKRLLLICAAVLALCSLICSCTTAYGEIVYKIQYTPANGGTASESELKNVFAEYFTDTTSIGIYERPDYSDCYEKVKWMSRLFRGFLCFWVSNELITIPLMRQRL